MNTHNNKMGYDKDAVCKAIPIESHEKRLLNFRIALLGCSDITLKPHL
jgi:hypothetical protein